MKKQLITIMAVTVFFTALALTSVQAQVSGNMSVTIPFDFVVSGKRFPAGEYQLRADATRRVTQIRGIDNNLAAYLPSLHLVQKPEVQETSKLMFNKYESQYFLSQVWFWGNYVGQVLEKGGKERLLQRESASNQHKAEIVTVAYKPK